MFSASSFANVAIVSPAGVHGISPATEHPLPLTTPDIVRTVQLVGSGFTISAGKNLISWVHVLDQAQIYMLLISDALEKGSGADLWGPHAYYFGASEEISFADLMSAALPALHRGGVVESEGIKQIDIAKAATAALDEDGKQKPLDSWAAHIVLMYGTDMRVKSTRAKNLGWRPREVGVRETIGEAIERFLNGTKQ